MKKLKKIALVMVASLVMACAVFPITGCTDEEMEQAEKDLNELDKSLDELNTALDDLGKSLDDLGSALDSITTTEQ